MTQHRRRLLPAGGSTARTIALFALFALSNAALTQSSVLPSEASAAVVEARRLLNAGDRAGAASVLERRVDEEPDDARAWYLLGFARHGAGEFEAALVAHERAAEFDQTRAGAAFNAACASARLGRVDAVFEWLAQAREAGYVDRAAMYVDTDLASVRADERFDAALPPLLTGAEAFVEEVDVIYEFHGEAAGDQYGWVARAVGDLDGDGVQELAITAPTNGGGGAQAGRVYVHSGKTGDELLRFDGEPGERLGNSVAPAGDVDGDGKPDVVVGAPGAGGSTAPGHAYILSGKSGKALRVLEGEHAGDGFGLKVHGVGDLDGAGPDAVAITANGANGEAGTGCGAVTIHAGSDGRVLVRLEGERAGDQFGSAVAGSMDGDALLVVGAQNAGPGQRGRAYVYRLDAHSAELAFVIDAGPNGRALGQYFASFPGDLDGDGAVDVYVSDWNDTTNGPHNGRIVVHSTASGELLLELYGARGGDGFGTSPSDAGDLDGDGVGDLAVGAWQNSDGGRAAGRIYVHSGAGGELLATYTSRQPGDTLGFDSVGLGDVNGDGRGDLLVTSAWSAVHGPQTGRVFVVSGPQPRPAESD